MSPRVGETQNCTISKPLLKRYDQRTVVKSASTGNTCALPWSRNARRSVKPANTEDGSRIRSKDRRLR